MNRLTMWIAATMVCAVAGTALGQSSSITYQGQLKQAGVPANGTFTLDFSLWDADAAGTLVAGPLNRPNTQVTNGLFNVLLDFPPGVFTGARRWLEVIVDGVPLTPLQELTAVPYALHSAGPWITNGQDVSYVKGAVGVGTNTPAHRLDVAGDTKLRERLLVGNDASFEPNQRWPHSYADFDFSHVHSDFTTSQAWSAFRSFITFDPSIDLPPSNNFSHELECFTPADNTHNFSQLQGPYMAAFHEGSGHVEVLAGGSLVAQTYGGGSVGLQIGAYVGSVLGTGNSGSGSIQNNQGLEVITGNAASPGSILTNDFSIYVYSPYNDQPMTNHYGIYLEDQDFGVNDSYAIYSAGGKNYLAGNLGIGTNAPQTKLHLGGVAGVDGIMFPDGTLQTTAAGSIVGGDSLWSQSGANIFYSSGNVGIGTSSPASKLDIAAAGDGVEVLRLSTERPWVFRQASSGPVTRLQLRDTSGGKNFDIVALGGTNVATFFASDLPGNQGSRVGIGTAAPLSKLDIAASGDGAEVLRFSTERPWLFRQVRTGPTTGLQLYSTVGLKKFEITAVEGDNVATFFADGANSRVGIGTVDPVAKLHVVGGMPVTPSAGGAIQVGNSTGTNVAIDDDEIMARYNGAPTKLYINYDGDDVVFGGAIDIGYEIVIENLGAKDAFCPAGKKVLGGGCHLSGNGEIKESYPLNNGWHCNAGDSVGQITYTVYAICARVK